LPSKKLVTLRNAADYITSPPKKGIRFAGISNGDRGADAGVDADGTDRGHEYRSGEGRLATKFLSLDFVPKTAQVLVVKSLTITH
jgi:hypothetical protein